MTAEESFEKWWDENDDPEAPLVSRYLIAWAAFLAGRKAGMEEAAEIAASYLARDENGQARREGANAIIYAMISAIRARMEGVK